MIKSCPVCGCEFECTCDGTCWCAKIKISKRVVESLAKKYPGQCLCKDCLLKKNL